MRAAYDDILADGLKRRHPVQQIFGALLRAEIADKTARSIKYQMASARLPAARELAEFDFAASPVNEPLIRDLAMGGFLEAKRNIVLVGGTGTGKTHLAVAIARSCIRKGARGRFYNVVDLVNHLEAEIRSGRQGRTADQLNRAACKECHLKSKCTKSAFRRVLRYVDEAILERMAERLVARPELLDARRESVEHPFGSIKQWMGQGAFLTRRLENVLGEFSITALAYNIRHAISLVGVPALIAAARA